MSNIAIFTMDIEEWYDTDFLRGKVGNTSISVMDGVEKYASILEKNGAKCTFFLLTNLARNIKPLIRDLISHGHNIALHGLEHIKPLTISPEQFEKDISYAKNMLEDMFGTEIKGYRAPCYNFDLERINILRKLGFSYDSSVLEFYADTHCKKIDLSSFKKTNEGFLQLQDFIEFPLAIQKRVVALPVSGGGYLRMVPYTIMKNYIQDYLKSHKPYVFNIHPFEMSSVSVPKVEGVRGFYALSMKKGIKRCPERVEDIIEMLKKYDYDFYDFNHFIVDKN